MADVEVVDDRDKNQGRAVADNAASSAAAHTTCDSAGAIATDMDATRSRLGELHRLLNDRKGSFRATYKKNAEANDRAYDMNQKTIQVLDALAEEYSAFEASMKKVTSVHSQTRLDELERAHKDQDRLQDELDCSCEDMASCQGVFQQLCRARSRDCKNKQRLQRNLQPTCYPAICRGSESVAQNIRHEEERERERKRERFVGCFHTGNTHAHFAQNLRLLTQLTQYSNYTLRLIESRCIIHPKPHTNDHSREHLARDLK